MGFLFIFYHPKKPIKLTAIIGCHCSWAGVYLSRLRWLTFNIKIHWIESLKQIWITKPLKSSVRQLTHSWLQTWAAFYCRPSVGFGVLNGNSVQGHLGDMYIWLWCIIIINIQLCSFHCSSSSKKKKKKKNETKIVEQTHKYFWIILCFFAKCEQVILALEFFFFFNNVIFQCQKN